jgi:hypothetical protein
MSFERRKELSAQLRSKFPDHYPIIVEKATHAKFDLVKSRFLCPSDMTFAKFLGELRPNTTIAPTEALFMFIGDTFVPIMATVGYLYEKNVNPDGFLYITLNTENSFG